MFNLLQNASDDQTALMGCLLTLCAAAFIVVLSFHAGPSGQRIRRRKRMNVNLAIQSRAAVDAQLQDRAA